MASLRVIEGTLGRASERFAAELADASPEAPLWTPFEWQLARAAAVLQGVTPLLADRLRWCGPRDWRQFCIDQRRATESRQRRIAQSLDHIHRAAFEAGIPTIALKGAALHLLGLYSPGERPMADVDLLVRQCDAPRTHELLQSLDYARTARIWKNDIYSPRDSNANSAAAAAALGEHAERTIKIELHTRIAERLPISEVDVTDCIYPPELNAGINPYASTTALMIHLLLHAAGNMVAGDLRHIQLHDIALLTSRLSTDEWRDLTRYRAERRGLWWAVPPLELTARYYPGVVPDWVLEALRPQCPRVLRRASQNQLLTEVSLARLRIRAFPGVHWATSIPEMFRYMRDRVRPPAEQLAMRTLMDSEPWAASSAWTRQSQTRRILRWLTVRPARPAGMYVVEAVLREHGDQCAPAAIH